MRVLLCTIGSAGDVHPVIGVGKALRARGHDATVVTNPTFERLAREHGLDFAPLGTSDDYARVQADPDLWHPTRGFQVIARRMLLPNVEPLYSIIARHDPAETVVFAAGTCFGARIAQEHLGFRLVTHHLAPALLWSRHRPSALGIVNPERVPRPLMLAFHRLTVAIADRELAPPVSAFRHRLGLAPARDIMFSWNNSPDRILGLFPDWFGPIQPDWPSQVRLTGFPRFDPPSPDQSGEALPELARGDRAPLIFTPGSANIHARKFFAAAVAASQALNRPAILLTRHREQLPDRLPPDVIHRPYIPLNEILPRAAVLIHHGGIGTTAQGLAAGIPHLVMPMSHDQPDNALRLRRLGVGDLLTPGRFTGARVAAALDRLLRSTATLDRCRDLAARCDPASLDAAACAIEEVAEQPSAPQS
jgi:UDP:flavonoid glycosyltransferase YjiC (YdhE family)